jgi:hypothetical protein
MACGALASETTEALGAALSDWEAYLVAGCAADHFLNPFAALAA